MGTAPQETEANPQEKIQVQQGEDGSVIINTQTIETFPSAANAFTSLTDRIRMYRAVIYSSRIAGIGSAVWGGFTLGDVLFKFTEPTAEKIISGAGLIVLGLVFYRVNHFTDERNKLTSRQLVELEASVGIIPPPAPEGAGALQP